jgi:Uncharacterized protein conserved in bacteria (DUF2188)
MKTFVVYPSARFGWEVLREGDTESLHFDDREAAISYGRCLADANRPSALKIETPYGLVEAAWVFEIAGRVRPTAPQQS